MTDADVPHPALPRQIAPQRQAAPPPASTPQHPAPLSPWAAIGIGVAAGLVGLAPSFLDGIRLPLQNLWALDTAPDDFPLALLPVGQYFVFDILMMLVVGGIVAGLAVRLIGRRRAIAVGPVALGLLALHLIAIAQSFAVVAFGLGLGGPLARSQAAIYFVGMLLAALISAGLAQLAWWLTSRASVPPASFGIALAAVPIATWIGLAFRTAAGPTGPPLWVPPVLDWVAPVIVGLALAWCGWRPASRLWVWICSLAALWLIPSAIAGVTVVLGSRAMYSDPAGMVQFAGQVFLDSLPRVAWTVLLALVIGVIGALGALVRDAFRGPGGPAARETHPPAGSALGH